jgi:hypothetical protein
MPSIRNQARTGRTTDGEEVLIAMKYGIDKREEIESCGVDVCVLVAFRV